MGLLDSIKSEVKKSGQNKKKIVYIREGQKSRYRFLQDMDDGFEFTFHDSFEEGINVVCREHYGKSCEYCEREDLRTRTLYAWSVWDYEAKEVKLFLFAVNNCSPVPALVAFYDTYGTLTDRDYVISVSGKQQQKSYTCVPMDKVKFRNDKAKPFSEQGALKILAKAFPCDDDEDEEEEKKPAKGQSKGSKGKTSTKSSKKVEEEDDDYDEELGGEDEVNYSEMEPVELYKLCKKRDIEATPKKPAKYYIKLLEENDEANDDWGDVDEDEDWAEDDE